MMIDLTPDRALLFRITHIANLPWLLKNGLHCASSSVTDPAFVAIGDPDLIDKRTRRQVPIAPGGTMADYVPFYFTPKSPMFLNINTGYRGIVKRSNEDIVVLLSSWTRTVRSSVRLVFTDRHAYTAVARWSSDRSDLDTMIDWKILQNHDFENKDRYPDKMERYHAEALAHQHVPPEALRAIGCVSENVRPVIEASIRESGLALDVVVRPRWYF